MSKACPISNAKAVYPTATRPKGGEEPQNPCFAMVIEVEVAVEFFKWEIKFYLTIDLAND